ncbi:MAG TPA: S1 family peptidase [Candidatus Corynebacterium avicola]|uniref:S1 family peptidase n=1 Tax=Candidatus Corynebacterium avicola TaxID=2838527 RepID=A0A9D1RNH9_9CORY|nr:S1 family peptidase [Candidatus Corynebacterium avicola]
MIRHRLRAAFIALSAAVIAGWSVPTATAAPEVPNITPEGVSHAVDTAVDTALNVTGEPGPHRVEGHYFTSPQVPEAAEEARPSVLVGPSTPLIVGPSVCTAAVAGYDSAGNAVAVTAGHCGSPGDEVTSADDPDGTVIGTFERAGSVDNGIILLNENAQVSNSYNDVSVSQLGGAVPSDLGQVCKTGITTGTSCGPVLGTSGAQFGSQVCASQGDSGAPVYTDGRLVGVLSGGLSALPSCQHPAQGPLHSPALSTSWDNVAAEMDAAGGVGAGFHLA